MVFRDSTYSVLLVSASEKFNTAAAALLPGSEYWPVVTVSTAREGQRRLLEGAFDIVLVNAPLPDEFGTRLAVDACQKTQASVLLLIRRELHDEIYDKVMEAGVVTLPKPTSEDAMRQTLRLLCSMRERLRRAEERQVSVEKKIEEMRLLNRAKWLLIERLHMTEEDAHRYISRQAMDKRISKREAAEDILRAYQ
ncbi:MAG: ANTAR domain-containing protein [Oscillospiraceae bacterium]|nr:ANTAR domain-containing protein [Oscillospiraceae bacterium]